MDKQKHGKRNPRIRRKLDMDQNLSEEGNLSSSAYQKKYNLRDLPCKSYGTEDDCTPNEDFSPDVSEYIPSPERLRSKVRASPASSLGGDSSCIDAIHLKMSRTPSTVSNLSFCLNQIDCSSPELPNPETTKHKDLNCNLVDISLKLNNDTFSSLSQKTLTPGELHASSSNDGSPTGLTVPIVASTSLPLVLSVLSPSAETVKPTIPSPSAEPVTPTIPSPSAEPDTPTTPSPSAEPDTPSILSPSAEPVTPTILSPSAEPVTPTIPSPSAEPDTPTIPSPSAEPDTPSILSPSAEPVTPTILSPSAEPVTPTIPSPSAEPDTPTIPSPSAEPDTPSILSPSAEPDTPSILSPSAEPDTPSILSPSAEPVTPTILSPSAEPVTPSILLPSAEPVTPTIPSPSAEPVTPSILSPSAEPVTPYILSPSAEPDTPSILSPSAEPDTPSILSPSAEPVTPTILSPSAEPVTSSDEPVTPSIEPVTSSAEPDTPSIETVTPSAEPVTPSIPTLSVEPATPATVSISSPSEVLPPGHQDLPAEGEINSFPVFPRSTNQEIPEDFEDNLPHDDQPLVNSALLVVASTSAVPSKEKSRKRKREEDSWQCNINKKQKNSGLPYLSKKSKKEHPAKTMGPPCSCRKACGARVSPEQRKAIFEKYYKMGDHVNHWQFLFKNIEVTGIKHMQLQRKCNRTQTLKYFFHVNDRKVPVCKTFFLNTLSISDTTVFTALEKMTAQDCLIDYRGEHTNRPHRIQPATEETVVSHIKLFPSVEAHYVRKDSVKTYLAKDLSIAKMYRLYKKWFAQQQFDAKMATARQYRTIFNTKFNMSFFKPKKDCCSLCTRYEQAEPQEKISLEETHRRHMKRKHRVREIKDDEKQNPDETKTIAIFDLEKVLYIPKSEVGVFYYKRKYAVYNFTVFDAIRKLGCCFMWHQQIAKRGTIEIGSCLFLFLKNEHERQIETVSFYSDGCRGQNKNRYLFAMYLYAAIKFNMTIIHRFFETGHSQNEGDSMHACIERELKNKVVYTPDQMYAIAMNAKVSGEKYTVKEMEQADFLNTKPLIDGKNWTSATNGEKVMWTKIMEVKASNSHPNKLLFKYEFDEEYLELNTEQVINNRPRRGGRRGRGRGAGRGELTQEVSVSPGICQNIPELQRAYGQPIPVTKALHSDLMSLCKKIDIPSHYHPFYESLIYEAESVAVNQINEDSSSSD